MPKNPQSNCTLPLSIERKWIADNPFHSGQTKLGESSAEVMCFTKLGESLAEVSCFTKLGESLVE